MLKNILDQVSTDRLRGHIVQLEGVRHRTANPIALDKAANYIEKWLGELSYDVKTQGFLYDGKKYRNIIAMRWGTNSPDKRILIVAHYDTVDISPGADDNASGVAVLLELASVLDKQEFNYSVQFIAVNLEENQGSGSLTTSGLQGSKALVNMARKDGWQIEGAIVLESVAFAGDSFAQTTGSLKIPGVPSKGNFIGIVANQASEALADGFEKAVIDNGIELPMFKLIVPGDGTEFPDARRSDHARFWDANYKAIMLTDTADFRNDNYHKVTDILSTLNLDFATNVCCGTAAYVASLAGLKA